MGGFFGAVSNRDVVIDVFFGVDYHSHLGTRRGGMAVYDREKGFDRAIHNIENDSFRSKFGKINFAVGEWLNADSFELALSLVEMGFAVSEIYGTIGEGNFVYKTYEDFSSPIKNMPSHRILALNRGEKEDCLKVSVEINPKLTLTEIENAYKLDNEFTNEIILDTIVDSYDRLLFPSLERECRTALTDRANEQAIKMFEVNLKPLLLQAPLKNNVIMGYDPGYYNGCKIAVIDIKGDVLDTAVVYPTPPQNKVEEAKVKLSQMIAKNKVDIITMLPLSIATSIDAFSAGISLYLSTIIIKELQKS